MKLLHRPTRSDRVNGDDQMSRMGVGMVGDDGMGNWIC
jgi:hypothetical protein